MLVSKIGNMKHLKVLNRKEIKGILKALKGQFGEFELGDFVFFRNNEDKIFLLSRKFAELDESRVHINNMGLYFCKEEKDGLRLTIEGAQLVGHEKNVVSLSRQQAFAWVRGEDIEAGNSGLYGYVIVRHGTDILGCGKFKEGRILNSVPKARRISGSLDKGIRIIKSGKR